MAEQATLPPDALALADMLKLSAKRCTTGVRDAAVAFSGGLDSSIVVQILSRHCRVKLYTVGTKSSHDLATCRTAAGALDLPLEAIEVGEDDIKMAARDVSAIIGTLDPVRVSFVMPLYFVCKRCKEGTVFTGQGADELFGGYNRYLKIQEEALVSSMENDLNLLLTGGISGEQAIAKRHGKELRYVFLDENIIGFARKLSVDRKVLGGKRKIILREAAAALSLPENVANLGKRAAQYSSGIMREITRLAGRERLSAGDWMKSLS